MRLSAAPFLSNDIINDIVEFLIIICQKTEKTFKQLVGFSWRNLDDKAMKAQTKIIGNLITFSEDAVLKKDFITRFIKIVIFRKVNYNHIYLR